MVLDLLGMGLIFGYGIHCVKKDIEAEAIDYHITPSMNEYDNKETIRKNFIKICKRSGIEMNNDKPIYLEDVHLGMEYLQYKGFNQNAVDYFVQIYKKKFNQLLTNQRNEILTKHRKIADKHIGGQTIATLRYDYYGNEPPKMRMDRLYKNPSWNKLVDNYTYIRGKHGNARYTEIWNLAVNVDKYDSRELEKMYEEVCWLMEDTK